MACCTLLAAVPVTAHAASTPQWEVSIYGGGATSAGMTAAQIAARPEASFTPFNPNTIYATGLQKQVWLRVRVSSEQEIFADGWLVGISKLKRLPTRSCCTPRQTTVHGLAKPLAIG